MQTPSTQLLSVIDDLREELFKYQNTPNAKEYIVNQRRNLIIQLQSILDNIANLNADSIMVDLFNEMQKMKKLDNTIDSFSVLIIEKENPKRTATINIHHYLKK